MSTTAENLLRMADANRLREQKFAQRKRVNQIALTLSLLALTFALFRPIGMLSSTVRPAAVGRAWATPTPMTPPPNAPGAIANSTLSDLSVLLAHSLSQRVVAGRYDLHPLIQEFAAG